MRGIPGTAVFKTMAIAGFCTATVLLIPLEAYLPGALAGGVAAGALLLCRDATFRRRLFVLLGLVVLLGLAPIHTDRSTPHFLHLGLYFAAAVLLPSLLLRRTDPGVIDWRFWPRQFRPTDVFYTLISIPLSWLVIRWYFFQVNPELPTHWPMPATPDADGITRLLIGINLVGIWDELFFVNTVYAILRSVLPFPVANLVQAVVYAAVLNDMAFTGIGPFVIYGFALTQGYMYEKSRNLLYVLIVHLIVDAFLVAAILQYHYPGRTFSCF